MRIKGKLYAQVLIFGLIFTTVSIAADSTAVLTLDQCIEAALRNNFGVIQAKNQYDAARGQVYTAWGSILPSVSVSAQGSQNWSGQPRVNPYTQQVVPGGQRTYSYSGDLSFDANYSGLGLGTYAAIMNRYHSRSSSFYGLSSTQSNLVFKIKQDYYNAVQANMLVGVSQDAVKRSEEGLRVAQSRYDLGSASMSDVLRAKVQLGNDKVDLVTKQNNHRLALSNLAFDMGQDVNKEYDVTERLPETPFEVSYESALQDALSNNPVYRQARFDLAVAKDLRLQAYSNFLPNLSLGLSHSTNVRKFGQLTDFKKADASYGLSARLVFNIFNGFSDYATLRAARNNAATLEEGLVNTRNSVALALRQAFLNLQQSQETMKLADDAVSSAQEDLNLVKEKYNLGAATILDVMDAEVTFRQAQTNQVQALFNYNLAVAQLENAMGR